MKANVENSAPAPVYLICGDEPLLVAEAADAVRARAKAAGFSEREVHFIERGFDWPTLLAGTRTISLFAERRLVEIRFSAPPDAAAGKALAELASDPSPDQIVLIVSPKLDRKVMGASWFKAIESRGVVQQMWPLELSRLPQWIRERLNKRGLQADAIVAGMMAERVEGNLLAAQQEIEKLALLHPPGPLDAEAVLAGIGNSARYDVLQVSEAAMRGQKARALRVLEGLRNEGVELVLILWAVNKDLQWIARAEFLMRMGQSADSAMNSIGVWRPRQAAMKAALNRLKSADIRLLIVDAARVDRSIKGALARDPWVEMQALVARLAGVPLARENKMRERAA